MHVKFICNDGGGFASVIEVPKGITVGDLFQQRMGGKPGDFLIRVNRQVVVENEVLKEGDRVSLTPMKIEGARL
jgi:sulfur carrier protein ThiS